MFWADRLTSTSAVQTLPTSLGGGRGLFFSLTRSLGVMGFISLLMYDVKISLVLRSIKFPFLISASQRPRRNRCSWEPYLWANQKRSKYLDPRLQRHLLPNCGLQFMENWMQSWRICPCCVPTPQTLIGGAIGVFACGVIVNLVALQSGPLLMPFLLSHSISSPTTVLTRVSVTLQYANNTNVLRM